MFLNIFRRCQCNKKWESNRHSNIAATWLQTEPGQRRAARPSSTCRMLAFSYALLPLYHIYGPGSARSSKIQRRAVEWNLDPQTIAATTGTNSNSAPLLLFWDYHFYVITVLILLWNLIQNVLERKGWPWAFCHTSIFLRHDIHDNNGSIGVSNMIWTTTMVAKASLIWCGLQQR